jgi:hypothetical protein
MSSIIYIDGVPEEFTGSLADYVGRNIHREDDPAIERSNGDKEWWINGECHREDGPAIETPNGDRHWYINGKRHRVDGPAIEYTDGRMSWYLNGEKYYTFKDFIKQLPEEDAMLVALEWK